MKSIYMTPLITTTVIDIECSISSTSSTIKIGEDNQDYTQEWEQLDDDERFIQW